MDPRDFRVGRSFLFDEESKKIFNRWGEGTLELGNLARIERTPLEKFTPGAVWTDRDLYELGKDSVNIFVALPKRATEEIRLVVKLNRQTYRSYTLVLDESGLLHHVIFSLPEGGFEVLVEDTDIEPATFMVAEYSLAPLEAKLLASEFQPKEDELAVKLLLESFGLALSGREVELELREGMRRLDTALAVTDGKGRVSATLGLFGAEGAVSLVARVTDEPEKSAEVAIRGAKAIERELTTVNPLGDVVEVSLLSLEGAREVKGLFFAGAETANTPFLVQEVIGRQVEITSRVAAVRVSLVLLEPLSGRVAEQTYRNVSPGQKMRVRSAEAWFAVAIGAWINEGDKIYPWEGWTMKVKPSELDLVLDVPEKVLPSSQVEIIVNTNKKGKIPVALVVRDARLTASSSGQLGLARGLKTTIASLKQSLAVGKVERRYLDTLYDLTKGGEWRGGRRAFGTDPLRGFDPTRPRERFVVSTLLHEGYSDEDEYISYLASPGSSAMDFDPLAHEVLELVGVEVAQAVEVLIPRVDLKGTVFAGIVEVEGTETVPVVLPDGIATYEVEAFALDRGSLDFREVKVRVSATKDVFAEVTAPPYVYPGEQAVCQLQVVSKSGLARVEVRTQEGVKLPMLYQGDLVTHEDEIETPARLSFVAEPGSIMVVARDVETGEADVSLVTIESLGSFVYRVNRLRVLSPGESVTLEELDALTLTLTPGLAQPLTTISLALADYSHKCCEQTAAVMGASLVTALQGNGSGDKSRDHFLAGLEREKRMFVQGQGFRMYPESGGIDEYYGKKCAQTLWSLRAFSEDPRLDQAMKVAVTEAVEMGKEAMRAYQMPHQPVSPGSARTAYEMAIDGKVSEALDFVKGVLKEEGDYLFCGAEALGGLVQARAETAYAAAVLAMAGEFGQAIKAANWVVSQLNEEGRLYSTIDSLAAMIMLRELSARGMGSTGSSEGEILVNGERVRLSEVIGESEIYEVEALELPVIVKYEAEVETTWDAFASNLPVTVGLAKNGQTGRQFSRGDSLDLVVTLTEGYKQGMLVHVCLPPSLVWIKGGGQVRKFTVDFEGRNEIRIPLAAVSTTAVPTIFGQAPMSQHFAVLVRNMFVEEEVGNPGLLQIQVS